MPCAFAVYISCGCSYLLIISVQLLAVNWMYFCSTYASFPFNYNLARAYSHYKSRITINKMDHMNTCKASACTSALFHWPQQITWPAPKQQGWESLLCPKEKEKERKRWMCICWRRLCFLKFCFRAHTYLHSFLLHRKNLVYGRSIGTILYAKEQDAA